jgi:hypothetical protein
MSARPLHTDQELAEAARALPIPECPPDRREQTRLLLTLALEARDSNAVPPRRPRAHQGARFAAAALVAGALFANPSTTRHDPTLHGTIVPEPGARFERLSGPPDELVRLHEGIIGVQVSPLARGERFRILVGDEEIEVRWTAFAVTAAAGRLRSVTVREGVVEVRPGKSAVRRLSAGHRWLSPEAIVDEATRAEPRDALATAPERAQPSGRPRPAGPRPPAGRNVEPSSAGESAFADGWAALRKQDFDRAAACFARARDAAAATPLAEDASFWHAVALKRGGNREAARSALESFLRNHATSDRAGEASVMLGWLLLEAGETSDAARRFQVALDDQIEPVRRGATAGLAAVKAAQTRRAPPGGE